MHFPSESEDLWSFLRRVHGMDLMQFTGLKDIIDAVQYGFDYREQSQNDNKSVPIGNTLQWLMWKKELIEVPDEFKEFQNKQQ